MDACCGAVALDDGCREVWGPGSWGRTDLSPRSSGARRQAGRHRTGLGLVNLRAARGATQRSKHFRALGMPPPISSKSRASSNGSMHQRATASSFPTMAGRMCSCTSQCLGARLVCECVQRAKGYQAFRILSMDESTAIHPAQMLPSRTHVSVTPTSGLERAQVKWFNRLRGFGFLTCGEGTPDIFVHMETLRRFGMTELRPGQYVLVRFGPGSKGMMAAEIQPESGSPGLSSH